MGLTKDDLIEGIEEPAGATTALEAAEGATTLFI
jgi:peroxiredoxin family protein